ncbi:hypothetical protein MOV00_003408 [Vibrio vulnificus]|uniref:DUF6795 domain-containing protein n=1 Tax=Vibrio vulnificus TaxID=672 RepID=UPI001A193FD9|nr:DUF6795 domain-containing protein [Vibrio vulnificus]EIZ1173254.1 hypothetical protein [Vibrio vulnificus]EKG2462024.1 hypothetical protein [Vibrio vulnificus]EMB7844754.1 hypothetical protein [Vibrio vulnificus]MDK2617500.1 hypothetical protein [Vibrio vulnificus]MDK2674434.1 hypothetical protein [Vibrio vulnificus]
MNTTQLMAALLFISFPLTSQGNMLSIFDFFKKNEYVLSPEISGHLTQDGQAFANKDVYLEGGFLEHRYNDKTQTDMNGYFHFEPMVHSQWLKKSPLNQAYSYFGIYLLVEEKKIYIWRSQLSYDKPYEFIANNLGNFKCNLNSPVYEYYFKNPVVPNGVDLMLLSRCDIGGYKYRNKSI